MAIAFLSFAGINMIFGSQEAAQAISGGSFGINGYQDEANLPFDFQFVGQGRITGGSDDRWMIGNVPILVGEHTQLNNELHPGDFLTLSGRILQTKEWLADRIELSQAVESFFTFNGPLEGVRGNVWRIGGHSLVVNLQTKLGSNLMANDLLLVTFTGLDSGEWLAVEIGVSSRGNRSNALISRVNHTPLSSTVNVAKRKSFTIRLLPILVCKLIISECPPIRQKIPRTHSNGPLKGKKDSPA